MQEKIRGKIIRIVSKDTVVINLGSDHGISKDLIFRILGKPEIITDPDSDEKLGEIKLIKARVKVTMVSEKYSIASSSWSEPSLNMLNSLLVTKNIGNELNVREEDIEAWKVVTEDFVIVGDEVETTINIPDNVEEKFDQLEEDIDE